MIKMIITKDINYILNKIENYEDGKIKTHKLPADSLYLDEELILIKNPINSGARFPYAKNGMTIWAYASGYITLNHSSFYIIPPSNDGKESYLDFFAIEEKDPISLLGVSSNYGEEVEKRYTVFSKKAAYYITKTKNFNYVVTAYIDDSEEVTFNLFAKNISGSSKKLLTSSFFNMLFKFADRENIETKWFKKVSFENNMFIYDSPEDIDRHTKIENYGVVKTTSNIKPDSKQITTSRMDYVGSRNGSIRNAIPLRTKTFKEQKSITHFTDTAINGDLLEFTLKNEEDLLVSYVISKTHLKEELEEIKAKEINLAKIDEIYNNEILKRSYDWSNFKIEFKDLKNKEIDEELLNQFIKLVNYEVHFAALSSNSGTVFLGVRDVMQQLETSLLFDPKNSRDKILEVLSFIDSSGLPPRQYSIPPKGSNARMDLRPFIDQGVWIISTLHTYLSYTGDYDFLDVITGYYDRIEPSEAKLSNLRESVYKHLLKVTDYLISQIDENTNCLKTLYGDWNDALDGLGLIKNEKGYGNGVSVMASLQLYDSINKMIDIASYLNDEITVDKYKNVNEILQKGILDNTIDYYEDQMKVLHGWGNNKEYFVGGFNDPDKVSRDSLTSNAFFIISQMIYEKPELKEHIVKALRRLDSKYGLRTFNPHFEEFYGFGRIVNLPKGTAENAATYVHATMFGIMALYMIGESEFAAEQIYKVLPFTHKDISTSPFILSNSYVYNEEANMDGESMSDWYTGAANTFFKAIIRGMFGVEVSLKEITLKPAKNFIANSAEYLVHIEGKEVLFRYVNENLRVREITLNDKKLDLELDSLSDQYFIKIDKKDLKEKNVFIIKD